MTIVSISVFWNVCLFILIDDGEFEKISNRLRSCFYGVLLDNIHSQNLPNIKTYGMTKPTRKFVILYQSQNRRQVLYFSLESSPISESGVEGKGGHLHTHHSSILTQEKRQMKKQSSDIMFKNVLIKFLFRTVTRIKHSILRSLFNRLKIYFSKSLHNKYNSGFVKISTPQEKKQKWLMRNQPSTRKQEHDRKPVCYVL